MTAEEEKKIDEGKKKERNTCMYTYE